MQSSNNATFPAPVTTDAFILNSNSNLVSDDILLQLQEQFGDSKQIYIINSSNNSISSLNHSTTANLSNISANSVDNNIQYLVVDKDVDINSILQDPNLFQNGANSILPLAPQSINTDNMLVLNNTNLQHHQKYAVSNSANSNNGLSGISSAGSTSASATSSSGSSSSSNSLEESVQRVQAPPPKRKKFEYKWDTSKNMTYQVFKLKLKMRKLFGFCEVCTGEN